MSLLELVKKTVMGAVRPRGVRKAPRVARPATLAPIVPAIKTAEGLFYSPKALAVYRAAKAALIARAVKAAQAQAKAEAKAKAAEMAAFAKAEMVRLAEEAKSFFPKPINIKKTFRKYVAEGTSESIQAREDRKNAAASLRAEKRAAEAQAKAEAKAQTEMKAQATRLVRAQEAAMWASRPAPKRADDSWRMGATETLLRRADRAIAQATACGGEEMAKAIAWVKAYVVEAASRRAALGLTLKVAAN